MVDVDRAWSLSQDRAALTRYENVVSMLRAGDDLGDAFIQAAAAALMWCVDGAQQESAPSVVLIRRDRIDATEHAERDVAALALAQRRDGMRRCAHALIDALVAAGCMRQVATVVLSRHTPRERAIYPHYDDYDDDDYSNDAEGSNVYMVHVANTHDAELMAKLARAGMPTDLHMLRILMRVPSLHEEFSIIDAGGAPIDDERLAACLRDLFASGLRYDHGLRPLYSMFTHCTRRGEAHCLRALLDAAEAQGIDCHVCCRGDRRIITMLAHAALTGRAGLPSAHYWLERAWTRSGIAGRHPLWRAPCAQASTSTARTQSTNAAPWC